MFVNKSSRQAPTANENCDIAPELAVPGRLSYSQELRLARVDIADDLADLALGLGVCFGCVRRRGRNIPDVLLEQRPKLLQPCLLKRIVAGEPFQALERLPERFGCGSQGRLTLGRPGSGCVLILE
jgi:hypothetical protein